jgi:hypothetical protein
VLAEKLGLTVEQVTSRIRDYLGSVVRPTQKPRT